MLHTRVEIIPTSDVVDKVKKALPEGSEIAVNCSPRVGPDRTMHVAVLLKEQGYRVVPSLAAQSMESAAQLRRIIANCESSGIDEIFAIRGDGTTRRGPYDTAASLIRDIAEFSAGSLKIGVAGYPERHPEVGSSQLLDALLEKQELASYLVTQMCFSPTTILNYVSSIRREGISLPVIAGIPGRIPRDQLLSLATKIGVGASKNFLSRKGPLGRRVLSGGNYSPEALLSGLLPGMFAGIHVYSFNNFDLPTLGNTTSEERRLLRSLP